MHRARRGLAALLLLLLLSVLGLEASRRTAPGACPDLRRQADRCGAHAGALDGRSTLAERQAGLRDLRARLDAGEAVPIAAQQAHAEALTIRVPPAGFYHNGLACPDAALIVLRADLPAWADAYVLRHELLHLLYPERTEAQTNWRAARSHPLGMVATAASSVVHRLQTGAPLRCEVAALWSSFRVYFLGLAP